MKIALDAMGGDFGPPNLVAGAVMALRNYQQIKKLYLVGDSTKIENELRKHQCNDSRIDIVHSTQVVDMSDRAWTAVRRKKDSSVSRAVDLVKRGDADAVVSAGHTGAAVAASMIKLRTLEGIDRPGIAALLPTQFNVFVLIDAGANIDARPEHLLQYAIMGSVYSRHVLRYKNPRVGLISLGEEDVKGNELTKDAFKMLKASSLNFRGNIEGRHLFEDPVEVVVCDGFVGNVILKTSESIAVAIFKWLRQELTRSKIHMVGAYLTRKAFRVIKDKTNYEEAGGMPLLGVNGICIIAHGASTALAIKNALRVAAESIEQQVNPHIVEGRKGRKHQRHGDQGDAQGDGAGEDFAERDRSHSRGNGHSRHAFPGHGVLRSEEDRSDQRRLSRYFCSLRRFSLWLGDRTAIYYLAYARHRPCDRGREIDVDHELDRSQQLRPFWRRRRRGDLAPPGQCSWRNQHPYRQRRPVHRHLVHAGRRFAMPHHARKCGHAFNNDPHDRQGSVQTGRYRHA